MANYNNSEGINKHEFKIGKQDIKLKTNNDEKLDVKNSTDTGYADIKVKQIQTTQTTGTQPITVSSTTKVDNLNTDMVDGSHVDDTSTTSGLWTAQKIINYTSGLSGTPDKTVYLADWDSSVSYNSGDFCMYSNKIYKSLQSSNTNQNPASQTSYWEEYGGSNQELLDILTYTTEPNGFAMNSSGEIDLTSSTINHDNGTRTISIIPNTEFIYYQKGTKYTINTTKSIVISNTEGMHYIYFDNTTLYETTTFTTDLIMDKVFVTAVYWDSSNSQFIYKGDERHGCKMDGHTHRRMHTTEGTTYLSGLAPGNFTIGDGSSNTHAQFSISSGQTLDEDLPNTQSSVSQTVGMPVFYRSGTNNFRKLTNTGYSVLTTGTGRLAYNQFTGGAWQLTEVTSGNYVLCHIFATNDLISGGCISIVGQNQYTNFSSAKTAAPVEINNLVTNGLPFAEFIPICTIIFQTNNSYANAVKAKIVEYETGVSYLDFRFSGISPVNGNSSIHNNMTGLQGGVAGEYYHLTSTQHTDLTDGNVCTSHKHDSILDSNISTGVGDLKFYTCTKNEYDILTKSNDTLYVVDGEIANVPDVVYNASMNRQAVIDGNFQIAQVNPTVGATVSNPSSGSYPVFDMWKYDMSADGGTLPTTINHSQQLLTSGAVPNSAYCYRISPNGAGVSLGNNSYFRPHHYIENGVRYLCGENKKVTLSFYARSTISNKRVGITLEPWYGTGGSPSSEEVLTGDNYTLTSTWTKFTKTFTTNTLSGKTFGTNNDDYLRIYFWYMWGSNFNTRLNSSTAETFVGSGDIEIAQVQLCAGDTALPFQPKSFDDELKSCQRYFEKSCDYSYKPGSDGSYGIHGYNMKAQTTTHLFGNGCQYKVFKRATPTVKIYGGEGGTFGEKYIRDNNVGGTIYLGSTGSVDYNINTGFCVLKTGGSGAQSLTIGREYSLCWVADARF